MKNRSMPPGSVIPVLGYVDVPGASRWLCHAFGFAERLRIGTHRIQLDVGDGAVVVADTPPTTEPAVSPTPPAMVHSVMVRVDNVDAHYARAVSAGANTSGPPVTYPFGERQYSCEDVGGHRWTFSQSVADSNPADWGGELVNP